jgi:hypothetical protein
MSASYHSSSDPLEEPVQCSSEITEQRGRVKQNHRLLRERIVRIVHSLACDITLTFTRHHERHRTIEMCRQFSMA